MTKDTKQHIFDAAKELFAKQGYDGVSMRKLAKQANISLSAIYHYYSDKDIMLQEIFDATNTQLGKDRAMLKMRQTMSEALQDRLEFQFEHMGEIAFVLKYYLHNRDQFRQNETGFVPEKTSLHIEEVLLLGRELGELREDIDIRREAKVITHAINGFVLEIYPAILSPKDTAKIIQDLHRFIMRSIAKEGLGVPMS